MRGIKVVRALHEPGSAGIPAGVLSLAGETPALPESAHRFMVPRSGVVVTQSESEALHHLDSLHNTG